MSTHELKWKRVDISQQDLLRLQRESDEFLNYTVTGDESGSKRRSMGFRHKRLPALKVFKVAPSASEAMFVCLCNVNPLSKKP
jgi:hypothetical protein